MIAASLLSAACDSSSPGTEADRSRNDTSLLVQTQSLAQVVEEDAVEGFASVLGPDLLLQADADIRTATIAATYSSSILQRATKLKASAAMSPQLLETAQRQAESDAVQASLLGSRLMASWGDHAPFLDMERRKAIVTRMSSGSLSIIRADIAGADPGVVTGATLTPLSGGRAVAAEAVWAAPSGNLSMPGASFFALVPAEPGLRPGDRARFSAKRAASRHGILIPNGAIVISQGEAWCFVETGAEHFDRRHVALDAPTHDGYLVRSGFAEGDRVVVRGAALLLARETAADGGGKAP